MHTIHKVFAIFLSLCVQVFAYQSISKLLSKEGFSEVKVFHRTERLVVFEVLKSADPDRWGIYTCLLPAGPCVRGYPAYMKDNKVLLLREGKAFELNLKTMEEKPLEKFPAIARIGNDKSVEIVHNGITIKIKDSFRKHWVYPEGKGVVPCGDTYWMWEEGWNLFINREGRVIKKKGNGLACILGKVIDLERDGEVVVFKPTKSVVKRINRVVFHSDLEVMFFRDFIVLRGQSPNYVERILVLSPDLKVKAQAEFKEVYLRQFVLSGGKLYITTDTYIPTNTTKMWKYLTDLYILDPEKGSLEKVLSYERKNNYEYYLFTPIGDGKYIVIKPPYSVCVSPSWQVGCTKYRYYKGEASVVELRGKVLKSMELPERTGVYPMDGAFVFCGEECYFVSGELEAKPLGFKGFSDEWGGEDIKVFLGEEGVFVLFKDGTKRRIPKGCMVRLHSRTVFCLYNEKRAELRDLETQKLLGESSVVPYPDHVYGNLVFKERVEVFDAKSGKPVDYIRPECEGLPIRDVIFSRDRFYVIYSDMGKMCMEVFKIDVD